MMGCIPVVEEGAADAVYRRLFNGTIFEAHPLEDIIVVVSRHLFYSENLIHYLANMTDHEIKLKKERMR